MSKCVFCKKLPDKLNNDKKILKVLSSVGIPLPLNFISNLTGIKKCRCLLVLKSLERYGLVKKTTEQKASFWKKK